MENNNHITELWQQLEREKTLGLVKRLYSSDIDFRIYATFQYPEVYYGVAFNFSNNIKIDISNFDNLKDLKVLLLDDTSFVDTKLLVIELLHPTNKDVFAALCENLIQSVIQIKSEQKIIRTVINQLNKWKTLFDKSSATMLASLLFHPFNTSYSRKGKRAPFAFAKYAWPHHFNSITIYGLCTFWNIDIG